MAATRLRRPAHRTSPCRLDIADLHAPVINAFLDQIERKRGNTIRSCNARLPRSLFTYAALRHPEHAADIARVLAILPKRADQTIVTFLTSTETEALLAAPERTTRTGRRDHARILLAAQTGLRPSELTALTRWDVRLGTGPYVACHGKAAKTASPRWLRARSPPCALAEHAGTPDDPLFTTIRGGLMSNDALQQRLAVYAAEAARTCPALASKNLTPTSCAIPQPWVCT